ncbi:asparagine synthase (glutamine-hydrolyzing) [Falsiroseomonas sp. HW251]|uniref:asparagine synthase (glutamine-hydrolyzing) n=1 Tax=Falsiroseomonas sp. HW251 TaxID=3390998 RepID=UPI003D30F65F
MCGIAGYLCQSAPPDPADRLLHAMLAEVAHRGPDGQGVFRDGACGLAHARLSIVDLAGGAQPMLDETGDLAISFNGEVFNHVELREELAARGVRFRTRSDTEVILKLYEREGPDCLAKLNGDFAFAIWDRRRQRLMLARDRVGVRPLYYALRGGRLGFASEIKALLAMPGPAPEMDPVALDQILSLWFPLPPRTAFRDIQELPPGHMLLATTEGTTLRRWWRLDYPRLGEEPAAVPEKRIVEELSALLDDAVRIRLRADVPVGAYVSGGIDSAIIATLARDAVPGRLETFSLTFDEAEFDESAEQEAMVRVLGTDHHSLRCTAQDIAAMLPEVIRHAERPLLRASPAPMMGLAGLVRRNGMKVVLTGEGADEVFAGYDLFKEAKLRQFCARQPDSQIRPLLFRRLYPWLPGIRQQGPAYLKAFFAQGLDRVGDPLFSHLPRFAVAAGARAFYSDALRQRLDGYDALDEMRADLPAEFGRWHWLHRAQYLEASYLLPDYILSAQSDRVAMRHAVESRFPYLDPRVIDFATRIPPEVKLKGLREKHVLRAAFEDRLPPAITNRIKQPYRAPDARGFFGPGAPDWVGDALSPRNLAATGLFDPDAVARLARKSARGPIGFRDSQSLLGVLTTQLWHSEFGRRAAGAPALLPALETGS